MNSKHIYSLRRLGRRLLGIPQLTLEEMPDAPGLFTQYRGLLETGHKRVPGASFTRTTSQLEVHPLRSAGPRSSGAKEAAWTLARVYGPCQALRPWTSKEVPAPILPLKV
jgi:hypothetical protein